MLPKHYIAFDKNKTRKGKSGEEGDGINGLVATDIKLIVISSCNLTNIHIPVPGFM